MMLSKWDHQGCSSCNNKNSKADDGCCCNEKKQCNACIIHGKRLLKFRTVVEQRITSRLNTAVGITENKFTLPR